MPGALPIYQHDDTPRERASLDFFNNLRAVIFLALCPGLLIALEIRHRGFAKTGVVMGLALVFGLVWTIFRNNWGGRFVYWMFPPDPVEPAE